MATHADIFISYRRIIDAEAAEVIIILIGEKAIRCSFTVKSLSVMKVMPLSEAKASLSRYGRSCHDEPVIVTANGVPSFQLVPLSDEDDMIDRLLEHNPKFRQMLKCRLNEKSISAKAARKRI